MAHPFSDKATRLSNSDMSCSTIATVERGSGLQDFQSLSNVQ